MKIIVSCLLILLYSCIPLNKAPKIEGDLIVNAKKFKKGLPNLQGYIFKDTKNANEFYNFINTIFDLKHINVDSNLPIIINNKTYYLSFYERERTTNTLNLIPIVADITLEKKGIDPLDIEDVQY